MKLIGLAGHAGAGKDHTYHTLVEMFPDWKVARVAFADGVRMEVEEALTEGLARTHLPALWEKPYSYEVRRLLQWWGTELRRAEDEDYWVKKGIERIEGYERFADLVVVTDVRFENEAVAIREAGGIVAEVYADEIIRARRLGGALPPAHASEIIDFEVDAIIGNNSTPILPPAVNVYLGRPHAYTVTAGVEN